MTKLAFSAAMMTEMCMLTCCMCMAFRAFISDMFSVLMAKRIAA